MRIAPFGDARDLLPEYLRPRDPSLDVVDALREVKAAIEANAAQPKQEPSSSERLTIAEAALVANVSEKTIRNWMKAGFLTRHGKGKAVRLSRTELLALRDGPPAAVETPASVAASILAGGLGRRKRAPKK
ncbi:MAG: helix-turn-helix domain-containing protein [Deltaproteobacteria bacterium]|nr:helix-turn-helix domain-containing protein [Deltaproteobacteria bacterium]